MIMAWKEIRMRDSKIELTRKLAKAKAMLEDICEDIDDMDDDEISERGGMWEARGGYGGREDDDRMYERRNSRGRYSRY